jgi:hypothetical protein
MGQIYRKRELWVKGILAGDRFAHSNRFERPYPESFLGFPVKEVGFLFVLWAEVKYLKALHRCLSGQSAGLAGGKVASLFSSFTIPFQEACFTEKLVCAISQM